MSVSQLTARMVVPAFREKKKLGDDTFHFFKLNILSIKKKKAQKLLRQETQIIETFWAETLSLAYSVTQGSTSKARTSGGRKLLVPVQL